MLRFTLVSLRRPAQILSRARPGVPHSALRGYEPERADAAQDWQPPRLPHLLAGKHLNACQAPVMSSEVLSVSPAACRGRRQKQVILAFANLTVTAITFRGGGLWPMDSRACRA